MQPRFEDGMFLDMKNTTCDICDIVVIKNGYITDQYHRYEIQVSEYLQENALFCGSHFKEWELHVGDVWRKFKEDHDKT
jgi:hypothetical protein